MVMRSMEVWEMIVQVEREMLTERTAQRKRLGALPDPPAWPAARFGCWRPGAFTGWARRPRLSLALWRPGKGRSAGGYGGV